MIRIFQGLVFRRQVPAGDRKRLVADFIRYKQEGVVPETFGRDAPYDHPNTLPTVLAEDLRHLHLASVDKPFSLRTIQFSRTSDTHLVYCQGAMDPDCYALIAILSPDAHAQALQRDIMLNLAKSAAMFRNQH